MTSDPRISGNRRASDVLREHFRKEAEEERLAKEKAQKPSEPAPIITPSHIDSPSDYIILEGRKHGSYEYPDLLITRHRLSLSSEVKKAAKELGLSVSETAEEADGHKYIGSIQWEPALKLNLKSGNKTLNLRQEADFLRLLYDGIQRYPVYDGSGSRLSREEITRITNEITEARAPYRGEWFDARFEKHGKELFVNYDHMLQPDGSLRPSISEPLEECLMQDKTPGIDLKNGLENATSQGLPSKACKDGSMWYWHPRADCVAGFWADSGRSLLYCIEHRGISNSGLGVRAAKIKV